MNEALNFINNYDFLSKLNQIIIKLFNLIKFIFMKK